MRGVIETQCDGELAGVSSVETPGDKMYIVLTLSASDAAGCAVNGAPAVIWYNADGDELDVPIELNQCEPDLAAVGCITDERVYLVQDWSYVPPPTSSVTAVFLVDDFRGGCSPSAVMLDAIGLKFADGQSWARIELPNEIRLPICSPVTFYHFGPDYGQAALLFPTDTPAPTPSPLEISWDEAVGLLRVCVVRKVTQAPSLEIWMVLDDGTEVHAYEPGINDVFGEVGKLPTGCGPSVVAAR